MHISLLILLTVIVAFLVCYAALRLVAPSKSYRVVLGPASAATRASGTPPAAREPPTPPPTPPLPPLVYFPPAPPAPPAPQPVNVIVAPLDAAPLHTSQRAEIVVSYPKKSHASASSSTNEPDARIGADTFMSRRAKLSQDLEKRLSGSYESQSTKRPQIQRRDAVKDLISLFEKSEEK